MSCLTQSATVNLIHHYCDIGVWTRMTIRFSERVAFVDGGTERFLIRLGRLGGYCTVEQAQGLGLANSPSQAQAQLNGLERAGFLRRVAEYPLVYQITKSVVRLIGTDSRARRPHAIHDVRWRLAVVSFYLEAKKWPADFFFQNDEKIAALAKIGCPRHLLPQRDRKSTRLNSSHGYISYAVFCLKKKKITNVMDILTSSRFCVPSIREPS